MLVLPRHCWWAVAPRRRGALITSSDIKDGTIKSADIKKNDHPEGDQGDHDHPRSPGEEGAATAQGAGRGWAQGRCRYPPEPSGLVNSTFDPTLGTDYGSRAGRLRGFHGRLIDQGLDPPGGELRDRGDVVCPRRLRRPPLPTSTRASVQSGRRHSRRGQPGHGLPGLLPAGRGCARIPRSLGSRRLVVRRGRRSNCAATRSARWRDLRGKFPHPRSSPRKSRPSRRATDETTPPTPTSRRRIDQRNA